MVGGVVVVPVSFPVGSVVQSFARAHSTGTVPQLSIGGVVQSCTVPQLSIGGVQSFAKF